MSGSEKQTKGRYQTKDLHLYSRQSLTKISVTLKSLFLDLLGAIRQKDFCLFFLFCLEKYLFAIAQNFFAQVLCKVGLHVKSSLSSQEKVCALQHHIYLLPTRVHWKRLLLKQSKLIYFHISFPSSYLASKPPKIAPVSTDMRHIFTSNKNLPQIGIGQLFVDCLSFWPSIR